jgi:hypothetical protein
VPTNQNASHGGQLGFWISTLKMKDGDKFVTVLIPDSPQQLTGYRRRKISLFFRRSVFALLNIKIVSVSSARHCGWSTVIIYQHGF